MNYKRKFGAVGAVVEVRCGDSICSRITYLQQKNVSATKKRISGGTMYLRRKTV